MRTLQETIEDQRNYANLCYDILNASYSYRRVNNVYMENITEESYKIMENAEYHENIANWLEELQVVRDWLENVQLSEIFNSFTDEQIKNRLENE